MAATWTRARSAAGPAKAGAAKRSAVPQEARYIAVEGAIGVGKSSLSRALAKHYGARLVGEPVEENPFLPRFYEDPDRYALTAQLSFLVERYRQQEELVQMDLFEQAVVTDYLFAKDRIFAGLTLAADELALYSYKTDRITGEVLPVLDDKNNHVIDALRYALEALRRAPRPVADTPKAPRDRYERRRPVDDDWKVA